MIKSKEIRELLHELLKEHKSYDYEAIEVIPDRILEEINNNIFTIYEENHSKGDYNLFLKEYIEEKQWVIINILTTWNNFIACHNDAVNKINDWLVKKSKNLNERYYKDFKSYFSDIIDNKTLKVFIDVEGIFKSGKTTSLYKLMSEYVDSYYICLLSSIDDEKKEGIDTKIINEYTDRGIIILADHDEIIEDIVDYFANVRKVIFIQEKRNTKLTTSPKCSCLESNAYQMIIPYMFQNNKDKGLDDWSLSFVLNKIYTEMQNSENQYNVENIDLKYFTELSLNDDCYIMLLSRIYMDYLKKNWNSVEFEAVEKLLFSKLDEINKTFDFISDAEKENNQNLVNKIYYILLLFFIKIYCSINSNNTKTVNMLSLENLLKSIENKTPHYLFYQKDENIGWLISYFLVHYIETANDLKELDQFDFLKDIDDIGIKKNYYDAIAIFIESMLSSNVEIHNLSTVLKKHLDEIELNDDLCFQKIKFLMIQYQLSNETDQIVIKQKIDEQLDLVPENIRNNFQKYANIIFVNYEK